MKKRILFLALLAITFGASAQTMKVQSAYADWQNNRLRNAMTNIEEACAHEKTSLEAKTWYYAGAIYARVVEISQSDSKEDQKIMKKQKHLRYISQVLFCCEYHKMIQISPPLPSLMMR